MSGYAVERFMALIRERTGNMVPAARRGFLAGVLTRRARSAGLSVADYVDLLGDPARLGDDEWESLIPLVTIKESYFFRAPQQFVALERQVLPLLVRARSGARRLRVWSAACARGEEPGTLAILLAESALLRGWDWSILATDVDEEALETARRGLYGERAVAQVPTAQLGRWFSPRGKLYELSEDLRERIEYRSLNLAQPPFRGVVSRGRRPDPGGGAGVDARAGTGFDLVFLRNVLIYFPRPLQRRVVTGVAETLREAGVLFLGATETLWQIQQRLAADDLGNCFCYRHRRPDEEPGSLTGLDAEGDASAGVTPAGVTSMPGHDLVRRERPDAADVPWLAFRGAPAECGVTAGEVEPSPLAPAAPPQEVVAGVGSQMTQVLESGQETVESSLAEALEAQEDDDASHLHAAPCGIQERLLEAARRLEGGDLDTAARQLEEVLQAAPSEPAAHALDGFLHDLKQNVDEAIQSYRAALYLDPALYQVRLLLADCMSRHGWRRRAEHEYREILASLATGRDRQLVPFGPLPVPDREGAERRCRRALSSG